MPAKRSQLFRSCMFPRERRPGPKQGSRKPSRLYLNSQMEMSFTQEVRTMIVLGMSVALITTLTLLAQTLLMTIEKTGRGPRKRVF